MPSQSEIGVAFVDRSRNSRWSGDRLRKAGSVSSHEQDRESTMKDFVVGIDVAKDKLDVYLDASEEWFTVENTSPGIAALRVRLEGHDVKLIVLEHSGPLRTSLRL